MPKRKESETDKLADIWIAFSIWSLIGGVSVFLVATYSVGFEGVLRALVSIISGLTIGFVGAQIKFLRWIAVAIFELVRSLFQGTSSPGLLGKSPAGIGQHWHEHAVLLGFL